jgi:hypothetical protein
VRDAAGVAAAGRDPARARRRQSRRLVTIDNLAGIIEAVRAKGLELVTVSQAALRADRHRLGWGVEPTFVFDGDCAFCTMCARFVRAWIPHPPGRAVAVHRPRALGLTAPSVEAVQWIEPERAAWPARRDRGASQVQQRFLAPSGGCSALRPITAALAGVLGGSRATATACPAEHPLARCRIQVVFSSVETVTAEGRAVRLGVDRVSRAAALAARSGVPTTCFRSAVPDVRGS